MKVSILDGICNVIGIVLVGTPFIYWPISFHFIFISFRRVTLQQSWFSRGPPLKRKKYVYS